MAWRRNPEGPPARPTSNGSGGPQIYPPRYVDVPSAQRRGGQNCVSEEALEGHETPEIKWGYLRVRGPKNNVGTATDPVETGGGHTGAIQSIYSLYFSRGEVLLEPVSGPFRRMAGEIAPVVPVGTAVCHAPAPCFGLSSIWRHCATGTTCLFELSRKGGHYWHVHGSGSL